MPAEAAKPKSNISMRHSKLKASEAALLAGELNKPSWQSKNEGIHERVSFEDSIWGFDLAGGSFYNTPLRVTAVKPDSRADKAGIRPGDLLLKVNDIETATLTIQEAHKIIIDSGVHLKINVTCPDDEEDSYHCWQDPVEESGYDSEEERRKERENQKKREIHAKVSSYWSLQWPWVSKRRVIYRESNCFLVPSKYEDNHRDKFSVLPTGPRIQDDIVQHSVQSLKTQQSIDESNKKEQDGKEQQVTKEQVAEKQPEAKEQENNNKQNGDTGLKNQNETENNKSNENGANSNQNIGNNSDDKTLTESLNDIFQNNKTNNENENHLEESAIVNNEILVDQIEANDKQDLNEDADNISELSESEAQHHSEAIDHSNDDITESQTLDEILTESEINNEEIELNDKDEAMEENEDVEDSLLENKSFDSILATDSEVLSKDEEDRMIEDILSDSETNNLNENDER